MLALAALMAAAAAATPATMPVRDLQPGMKCVGQTVYTGTTIEKFDCEILGVLPGAWGPGDDVIIARLTGPQADRYGIAAGMSGSPVFVDGKLIGALSLSMGTFQREPIAGITPIDAMLRVNGSTGWPGPRGGTPAQGGERMSASDFRPITTPLVVSGLAPEMMPVARTLLEPYGFVLTAGGGPSGGVLAPASAAELASLTPGSAVSGLLVEGDMNVAGTGTVTWRDDKGLLAFGHSFLLYGGIEMPMATANVIATVPSDMISFKLAAPRARAGAVTRDNRTAIAGRFAAEARTIPVTVKLPAGTVPQEIRFRVFRNRFLSAPMMTMGVLNGLVSNASYDAEGTVRLEGKVKVAGHGDITLSRTYFDPGMSGAMVPYIASELSQTLQKLFDNELTEAAIDGVELTFAIEKGRRETRIDAAWPVRTSAKPGETVGVRVRMRPWRGPAEVREVQVKVPEGTPPGPLTVFVADAKAMEQKDRVTPALQPRVDDLASLIQTFNLRRDEDTLYVRVARTAHGATVRGQNLPALPPTALGVVRGAEKSAGGADPLVDTVVDEIRMPLGSRVTGTAEFTLRVE